MDHREGVCQGSRQSADPLCHSELVDLRTWIIGDLAAVQTRLHQGVVAHVPASRWTTRLGPALGSDRPSSSISWLLFHMSHHHDLAINTAILGRPPLLGAHREDLGIAGAPAAAGLPEREDPDIADALDQHALLRYATAVTAASLDWMERVAISAFDTVPEASSRLEREAGVDRDAVPWLHDMWQGKTVAWFVQWEAIGHGHTHVGEMTGLRGQLGHSPF
jgi:hypothetical protein